MTQDFCRQQLLHVRGDVNVTTDNYVDNFDKVNT